MKLGKGYDLGVARVVRVKSDVVECEDFVVSSEGSAVSCVVEAERLKTIWSDLDLNGERLSNGEQVKCLMGDFQDVFALSDGELGCTDLVQHHTCIETGDHAPIKQLPYRTPVCRRGKILAMVNAMQDQGVIQPSASPWASPIVLVPKKDGTLRFCVDYRHLNSVTRKDAHPLPLDTLGGARYFTSLVLAAGYWQVPLDPESSHKTAFTIYQGLFEFVRMPFGLCNAPVTFQRLMQRVLTGLDWCFIYLDDILIVSSTFEEHLLREVLARLRKAGLRLKPGKCHLLKQKVCFLGRIISEEGVYPDPVKTEKVKEYPAPTDVTSLRQFLGLASYYRRFVKNFAKIAAPLHSLTRKNMVFQWLEACEAAFCQLKELLVTAPVLGLVVMSALPWRLMLAMWDWVLFCPSNKRMVRSIL